MLWENTVLVQGRRCQSGWEGTFHRKRHRGGSGLGVYLDIPVIFSFSFPWFVLGCLCNCGLSQWLKGMEGCEISGMAIRMHVIHIFVPWQEALEYLNGIMGVP